MSRARTIADFGDGIAAADMDSTLDLTGKTVTLPTGAGWTTLNSGSIGTSGGKVIGTFPSGVEEIWISLWDISKNNDNTSYVLRLSDSTNDPQSSGYYSHNITFTAPSTNEQTRTENGTEHYLTHENNDSGATNYFDIFIRKSNLDTRWTIQSHSFDLNSSGEGVEFSYGFVSLSGECTKVTLYPLGGSFDLGTFIARYR